MIYETPYMRLKIHNDIVDWNTGTSIFHARSIRRVSFDYKGPRIVVKTSQGEHYLHALSNYNTARDRKNATKDLGNAFGWIYHVAQNYKGTKE